MKIKKFFSYLFACFFATRAAADAVNCSASEDELDDKILKIASFRK
ncbi:MAG: hypothetical protein IKB02_04560 [Clostridia bacterium]|nr:hypothetical protein [Clostridia bacterium]